MQFVTFLYLAFSGFYRLCNCVGFEFNLNNVNRLSEVSSFIFKLCNYTCKPSVTTSLWDLMLLYALLEFIQDVENCSIAVRLCRFNPKFNQNIQRPISPIQIYSLHRAEYTACENKKVLCIIKFKLTL